MNGFVWSNGGMILAGETEVLGEKHYTFWVVDEWMSVEKWWNDTERGKLKYWEKNIIHTPLLYGLGLLHFDLMPEAEVAGESEWF